MHLCKKFLDKGHAVFGVDNMNSYYDKNLKIERLKKLLNFNNFEFLESDISDSPLIDSIFRKFKPNKVVNLAAQAGVRYSIENPTAYVKSNILGFLNILENCKKYKVEGLIYASSSSVYGGNKNLPFSIEDDIRDPVSIYAVSKITNELMARAFSNLYGLHTTGLRYFTVYGPWGRPDMAMFIFTEKIKNNKVINVYNHGDMLRDFTYIDDIIDGTYLSIEKNYECEIFNLGNNNSSTLMDMISQIESCLGKKAKINFCDIQLGDVKSTLADIEYSKKMLGFSPKVNINKGIPKFIDWYNTFYI